jgi:hypothetical protein
MLFRSLLTAAGLLVPCAMQAAEPAVKNLLANASFEEKVAADGLPLDWNGFHSEPADGYRHAIADTGHTGKHSLQVVGKGKFGVVRGPRLPVDRTLRYRASGWVKIEGEDNSAADVKFHYYDKEGRYIDQTRVTFLTPATKGWQQLNVVDQLEQFPEAAAIELAVAVAGNADAWFDDLTLNSAEEDRPAKINWVANGDMEDTVADRVAGWGAYVAEGGKVTGRSDGAERHGGKRSLHLTGEGAWISTGSVRVRAKHDHVYKLSAFVKSKKGPATIGLAYFKEGEFLGVTASEAIEPGDEWKPLSVESKLEDYPTATHIVALGSGMEEIDAWYDDVVLIATPKAEKNRDRES